MARTPTIEWQVAGACNYDCSYCIQSRRYRRGRPDQAQLDAAIAFFASLPGTWEIKCSGGEAFAHPLFLDRVVPGLMARTPHRISVLTNFSASERDLLRFAAQTRGRLAVFSASLHLEHADVDAFARKARWFVDLLDPDVRFVVNQVVLPGREAEAAACRDRIEAEGLRWFPQLFKTKGGVADYPDEAALRALIGSAPGPREANVAPSYQGRICWAGVDYFTVDKDGDVWSCRTAKRHGEGRLGNAFLGTVERFPAPSPCPYAICPCTVPANRGMIEGIGPQAWGLPGGPAGSSALAPTTVGQGDGVWAPTAEEAARTPAEGLPGGPAGSSAPAPTTVGPRDGVWAPMAEEAVRTPVEGER